ncbi:TetR/AcrR family transcriptional regulator [Aneurinibacillus aneurinilyticus]|jgi:AcrR family transcriptional regulator|uniref:Transcriptional regulator, TetR family n=1 Tax=Aneurinibacillus aneurinilyticus ATCC 12856 TaxID=649747 RepID=U1YI26_ANEAE|nr:TetR/AcrR family transcriptional regulator [Aneurinibacillus aneurinilyticus]ERI11752.1 transcriptional regulator, TetR family [Aneurinibacillus aneurinilyticus ATCC 12856]MCI1696797.1 TetR family transcriptional regulator [Aneurinibacillus aneurinilyticus]MED0705655.1 TetR/AcrR family transcriptional regulator [Aneurinibacillus aneurinilyticus]MED0724241.1 TetR/AcrR family transcriptional regulator [Aneurinibacillus aneurinilyticus]MED0734752.1 TetR/AcrR family transcriptional regulator [A
MPKLIDHEERRKQIAEATWDVILEQGMEGATVRNIAKKAGLSLGALRHYFSTQEELLVYTMKLVKEKATARINKISIQDLHPKEKVLKIILEIVPINDETMAEMKVWFAFTAYFRHKKNIFDAQHDGIFIAVQKLVDYLDQMNLLKKNLDIEIEIEKLYALIDGLALHAMLEPQRVNKERIVRVLVHHLNSICVNESDR